MVSDMMKPLTWNMLVLLDIIAQNPGRPCSEIYFQMYWISASNVGRIMSALCRRGLAYYDDCDLGNDSRYTYRLTPVGEQYAREHQTDIESARRREPNEESF